MQNIKNLGLVPPLRSLYPRLTAKFAALTMLFPPRPYIASIAFTAAAGPQPESPIV